MKDIQSLLEAAGATFLFIALIIYKGSALIATMTATFHANGRVTTKDKSAKAIHSLAI